jgi:hypothetical protein
MRAVERDVAAADDEPDAVSEPIRNELLRILNGDSFPGISNRLSRDDQWLPEHDVLRASDRDFLQTRNFFAGGPPGFAQGSSRQWRQFV